MSTVKNKKLIIAHFFILQLQNSVPKMVKKSIFKVSDNGAEI